MSDKKPNLVLSFKVSESVFMTGGIEVYVASIKGDKIRLGVRAPKEVRVMRQKHMTPEIHEEMDTVPISRRHRDNLRRIARDHICNNTGTCEVARPVIDNH